MRSVDQFRRAERKEIVILKCKAAIEVRDRQGGTRKTPSEYIGFSDCDLLAFIRSHVRDVEEGDEATLLLVYSWTNQCSLGFERATLVELERLGLALCIRCIEVPGGDEVSALEACGEQPDL